MYNKSHSATDRSLKGSRPPLRLPPVATAVWPLALEHFRNALTPTLLDAKLILARRLAGASVIMARIGDQEQVLCRAGFVTYSVTPTTFIKRQVPAHELSRKADGSVVAESWLAQR